MQYIQKFSQNSCVDDTMMTTHNVGATTKESSSMQKISLVCQIILMNVFKKRRRRRLKCKMGKYNGFSLWFDEFFVSCDFVKVSRQYLTRNCKNWQSINLRGEWQILKFFFRGKVIELMRGQVKIRFDLSLNETQLKP